MVPRIAGTQDQSGIRQLELAMNHPKFHRMLLHLSPVSLEHLLAPSTLAQERAGYSLVLRLESGKFLNLRSLFEAYTDLVPLPLQAVVIRLWSGTDL